MQYDVFADHSWSSCSVGFPAWNNAGTRYFISAGHCFRTESGSHYVHPDGTGIYIYTPTDHTHPIGFERSFTIPSNGWYDDVSLVEMYPGKTLHGEGWQHIPDNPTTAAVGDKACLIGFRHNKTNCGTVTQTDASLTETGYPWNSMATRASYCSHPGDSGGAIYNDHGALGIEITGSKHNEPGTPGACRSAFIPIDRALKVLRKSIPSLSF
ncbi:S1 family peptidase [Candidatus Mycobacterium methanotrophicum]|uniref:S1 family peptidase n=1 Tax=Candidatus Mycobacterium methanotrophicum TaxID=2943498 RepID=A0ABY4QRZ2_9MYCO|nr:S1 family peptidase [Candidatus Mycobacterium methanotrophicum]UQX13444.1 S1 family peptidase [Candidatus Mycobacterium methanotrophicum]